jgi:hypothetical protein
MHKMNTQYLIKVFFVDYIQNISNLDVNSWIL